MALKLALLGGSFDPPHLGHLALARAAAQVIRPDQLLWLPAGQPWQKAGRPLAASEHRQAMVRLLIRGEPGFVVDDRELRRNGPSYTVDTLAELRHEHPGAILYLLIGQDQYANLPTWHQPEQVLAAATLVVVPRAGQSVCTPAGLPPHRLLALPMPDTPVSATQVRAQVRAGKDVSPLVGPEVAGYIGRHSLYLEP